MLATAHGDSVLYALTNRYLGAAHQAQGDYRRAIDCYRQTVTTIEETRYHEFFGLPLPPALLSYALLAWCHAELGRFAEGKAMGDAGLRITEAITHPASLIVASWGVGLLSLLQGDLPRALPHLERAMGICQDTDIPFYVPMMAPAVGAAYTLCGRVADAVSLLTQALEQTMATAMVGYQARCRLPLGEAQMRAGRLEEAHTHAEQALALTCAHQERGHQAYALRLLGDIAARREPLERAPAETYYQQALALAEELGMRPLQAHCHHALGTLYATTGQWEQARVALATAIDLYRAMDMIFWLPQAEATLAQVEAGETPESTAAKR
jgi:tetratricopeptide (TPR) repeat protein